MTRSAKAAFLAFALVFAGQAYGQTHYTATSVNEDFSSFSGNDFITHCPPNWEIATNTEDSRVQAVACMSYVTGVSVGAEMYDSHDFLSHRTYAQVYDIVAKFISDHPELRDKQLSTLIVTALIDSVAH